MDNNNPPNRAAGTHEKFRQTISDPAWSAGGEKDMAQLMGFIGRGGVSRSGAEMDHKYDYSDVDPETGLGAQVHAEDCPACKAAHEASTPYPVKKTPAVKVPGSNPVSADEKKRYEKAIAWKKREPFTGPHDLSKD